MTVEVSANDLGMFMVAISVAYVILRYFVPGLFKQIFITFKYLRTRDYITISWVASLLFGLCLITSTNRFVESYNDNSNEIKLLDTKIESLEDKLAVQYDASESAKLILLQDRKSRFLHNMKKVEFFRFAFMVRYVSALAILLILVTYLRDDSFDAAKRKST